MVRRSGCFRGVGRFGVPSNSLRVFCYTASILIPDGVP
jgi:hypothetical protein